MLRFRFAAVAKQSRVAHAVGWQLRRVERHGLRLPNERVEERRVRCAREGRRTQSVRHARPQAGRWSQRVSRRGEEEAEEAEGGEAEELGVTVHQIDQGIVPGGVATCGGYTAEVTVHSGGYTAEVTQGVLLR